MERLYKRSFILSESTARSQAITIGGKDGSDAKPYLEKQVNEALENLKKMEQEETEE